MGESEKVVRSEVPEHENKHRHHFTSEKGQLLLFDQVVNYGIHHREADDADTDEFAKLQHDFRISTVEGPVAIDAVFEYFSCQKADAVGHQKGKPRHLKQGFRDAKVNTKADATCDKKLPEDVKTFHKRKREVKALWRF
jgi:hypothetical protein